jgi:hypothetical protein
MDQNNKPVCFCWNMISGNIDIPLSFIEKYIHYPWNWGVISGRYDLTLAFIEKYIHKDWDWKLLSLTPNLTMDFIESHLHYPWVWYEILKNRLNINTSFIKKHSHRIVDYDIFSEYHIMMKMGIQQNASTQ